MSEPRLSKESRARILAAHPELACPHCEVDLHPIKGAAGWYAEHTPSRIAVAAKDQEPWPCLVVRQAAQLQAADAQLVTMRRRLQDLRDAVVATKIATRSPANLTDWGDVNAQLDQAEEALNSTAEDNKEAGLDVAWNDLLAALPEGGLAHGIRVTRSEYGWHAFGPGVIYSDGYPTLPAALQALTRALLTENKPKSEAE